MANQKQTTVPRGPRGGHGPIGSGEKPKNFKVSMKRILRELWVYKGWMLLVLITAIVGTLFNIVGPKQLGRATTEIFQGLMQQAAGTGSIDFNKIGEILLIVLGLYGISALFTAIQGFVMSTVSQQVVYQLRTRLMDKIDRLPMSYFESRPYGEVLSRVTNDIDTMGMGLNQSITTMITSLLTMIGIFYMMVSISWVMALVTVLLVPLSMVLVGFLMGRSQVFFKAQQEGLGTINGQVEEVYAGQTIVKAFNQEAETLEQFVVESEKLRQSAWKSQFFSGLMFPLMNFVSDLGYLAVVILGAYFAVQGLITVGDIQAFTQYARQFTQPITQMAQVMTTLQSMAAAAERVYEFLDEAEEDQMVGELLDTSVLVGDVTFEHVKFGYKPEQIVINDFSATVKAGQKVALVGPTGAGKSTMVKLLMRFYDLNGGKIYIDQHQISEYSRSSLRQSMAMVLQDTWLFQGSIMENIRYGRLEATDEEVYEAAKSARVHHFIQSLPGGYHFELNEEGTNISQGQKQLLTIARAILADRPVLILDEATSSVDTRTEILIQEAMDRLMKGRTSFVIAHRLSTIRDADLILYMESGDIVEQGNHEELMALQGRYAELYNSQFQTT